MKAYLAQILCGPRRHAIIAYAVEADEADRAFFTELRRQMERLKAGVMAELDPWCGICGAPASEWIGEVGPTKFATLAEAMPHLRAANRLSAKRASGSTRRSKRRR